MADIERDVFGTNPKDKIGAVKAPLHLVPPSLVIAASDGFRDGAKKYGPFNWRENKVVLHIYYEACLRHLFAFWDGEDTDPISGVPHLSHAISCLAILVDAASLGQLIDDRPRKGAASSLLEALYTKIKESKNA